MAHSAQEDEQTLSRELSGRRPTYLMDTPCLTRNYVIRLGEMYDITDTPAATYGDGSRKRLIDLINDYIDRLNDWTHGFARTSKQEDCFAERDSDGFLKIEKFQLRTANKKKNADDEKKAATSGQKAPDNADTASDKDSPETKKRFRTRHETAFGIRLFRGVPVEVLIDIHREYFTIQFRAYPNAAVALSRDENHPLTQAFPQLKTPSEFTKITAKLLRMLSIGEKADWDAFNKIPGFDLKDGLIREHPDFRKIARDEHFQNGFFETELNDNRRIDECGGDCVAEASARLLYDDFWYYVLKIPKNKPLICGLSPKRFFDRYEAPPPAGNLFARFLENTRLKQVPDKRHFRIRQEYLPEDTDPDKPAAARNDAPPESEEKPARKKDREPASDGTSSCWKKSKESKAYFTFWSIFKGVAIRPADSMLELRPPKKGEPKRTPETVFERAIREFLFTHGDPDAEDERFDKNLVAGTFIYSTKDNPEITEDRELAFQRQINQEFQDGTHHINQFSQLLSRVLGYRRGRTKYEDHTAGSTVLCGVADGLGIYGSSFGRSTTLDPAKDEVRYFLFYRGPSRNQLARLNRRINNAGEARVLSIAEMKQVRDAGDELRQIEAELNHLMSKSSFTDDDLAVLRKRHANAETRLVRGGLRHRIGRTTYYSQLLHQRVRDLRIRRLVGWQTYDEYIARVFEPQYDTYNRYGARSAAVERKLTDAGEVVENRTAARLNMIGAMFAGLAAVTLIAGALQIEVKFLPPLDLDPWETFRFWIQAAPAGGAVAVLTFFAAAWFLSKLWKWGRSASTHLRRAWKSLWDIVTGKGPDP